MNEEFDLDWQHKCATCCNMK